MSRSRVPALVLIIFIFAASAGLRIATEGPQWASALSGAIGPAYANLGEPPADISQQDVFLESLQRREAELDLLEQQVNERTDELADAERALALQIEQLEQAEQTLRDTLSVASGAAETDVVRLVSVYESMRPATAAPLFGAMEPSFAAGFLMRMEPEAAGAILSAVTPEQAYALSAVMAGRHAAVVQE